MASQKSTPICGVYRITCLENGKSYIGSSINIHKRWNEHRRLLDLGKHHSSHLQRAWQFHGRNAFEMDIVEECNAEMLLEREQHWLGMFESANNLLGYNISKKAGAPMAGLKHKIESLARMAVSHFGFKHTEESKAKISTANKGVKKSAEHIENMRKSQLGKKASDETRRKLSEIRKNPSPELRYRLGNGMRGKHLSQETLDKIFDARAQRFRVTSPDGKQYEVVGLARFCREHDLDQGSMTKVAQGKRSSHKGWQCESL